MGDFGKPLSKSEKQLYEELITKPAMENYLKNQEKREKLYKQQEAKRKELEFLNLTDKTLDDFEKRLKKQGLW